MPNAELFLELERDLILAKLGMLAADRSNQLLVIARDERPPDTSPPAPEQPVTLPVPAEHRLGLDDDERVAPALPVSAERHPENAISAADSRLGPLAQEHAELLLERGDADGVLEPPAKQAKEPPKHTPKHPHHVASERPLATGSKRRRA